MVRALKFAALALTVLALLLGSAIAYMLIPQDDPLPLPPGLVALSSSQGTALLEGAEATADHNKLSRNFESQRFTSFCGVASSVTVLKALGHKVTQSSLFDGPASTVKPMWRVALAGMNLDTLEGLLEANGVEVTARRADAASVEEFRAAIRRNLAADGDYLIVNYQREKLGQDAVGHISPVSAFDEETDRVLVMDTAAYKYPPTWVSVAALHSAMATPDSESGLSRGWLEVRPAS